eukprot:c5514_g1_i1.p1 GENE.c5514_g1_i1~~c5514_g1_i1.p1  ORF type:complete len:199 (+),score=46.52 c5514_g1_i1:79-597(+)
MTKRCLEDLISSLNITHVAKRSRCFGDHHSSSSRSRRFEVVEGNIFVEVDPKPPRCASAANGDDSGCEGDTEVVVSKKFDDIVCGRYQGDHLDKLFRDAIRNQAQQRPLGPESIDDCPSSCQAIVLYIPLNLSVQSSSSFGPNKCLDSPADDSDDERELQMPIQVQAGMDLD